MNDSLRQTWTVTKVLFLRLRFIFVFIILGLIVGNWAWIQNIVDRALKPAKTAEPAESEYEYYCPMHPSVVRPDASQNCPICGMPLSRRKRGEQTKLPPGVESQVQLTPVRVRQAGLATEEVGYRTLVRELRTVGFIEIDERRLYHVTAWVPGRIEKFYKNFVGQEIKSGEPYAALYSPELLTTQEDYLRALRGTDDASKRLIEAARRRLKLWGITDEQIAKLEKEGKASPYIDVVSPYTGTIMSRSGLLGHWLEVGASVYQVADLSVVWMTAEVFERDIALIQEGQVLEITSEAYPGETFRGTVSFIYPTLQTETRTMKVRVDVDNSRQKLKPGMYVTATVRIPLGRSGEVWYDCCPGCKDVRSDVPKQCEQCGMQLFKCGGVEGAPIPETFYQCPMHPEITSDKPGKCVKCNMELVRRERKPEPPSEVFYMCPHHPDVKSDKPGTCPKCGGVPLERHEKKSDAPSPAPSPGGERTIYVCDMHPEQVFDQPGQCAKCGGMELEKKTIPAGAQLVYVCPDHPDQKSDHPGICPKDGKALQYKIAGEATRIVDGWACPMHPYQTAGSKARCPQCGGDMKHYEYEQVLAVPFSAVIDTGLQKIVFVEEAEGVYNGVKIEVGPRAGEYYPIIRGLTPGQRVVTSGAFLLDAEARLNPAAKAAYFGASDHQESHK
ncbi:MAG: efflux RND transporter periplasmic adaptor subunit [Planctomycetes bacterium]|nr:efflux RND transporter periplasmic adaptor subunit [Planctomycetota bacterium]